MNPQLPPPRAQRYASLDLWRGVACLLVLINHAVFYQRANVPPGVMGTVDSGFAAAASRLWLGVPMFFVISGYCITATIDSHRRQGTPVRFYFLRRFRRIFPPYWIVLIGTALIVGIADVAFSGAVSAQGELLKPWWFSPSQWIGSVTLTETWRAHLVGGPKGLFLGHAWTLCYEEQFYVVSGGLLMLCPRRYFLGAGVLTGAVAAIVLIAARLHLPIDGFFFDGGWVQFALGILVYYVLNYGGVAARRIAAVGFTLVAAGAASYGSALLEPTKNNPQVFFVAGAFACALLYLHRFDHRLMAEPLLRPLRSCGLMCYSLYLVHLPVVELSRGGLQAAGVETAAMSPILSLALCGVASLWVAWRFHVTVERRFMSAPSTRPGRPVIDTYNAQPQPTLLV